MNGNPSLMRLIEAARRALSDGDFAAPEPLVGDALAFHDASNQVFEAVAAAVPLQGEGQLRVGNVRKVLRDQRTALDMVRGACARRSVTALSYAVIRLEELNLMVVATLQQLADFESQQPQQSPVPLIDQFIKVGLNVQEGLVDGEALSARLPLMQATFRGLREDLDRFRLLHQPPQDLPAACQEQIEKMESSVVSIAATLRDESSKPRLHEALGTLRSASQAVVTHIRQVEEMARKDQRYSNLRPLEEMWRGLQAFREGKTTAEALQRIATNLQALGRWYVIHLDAVTQHPLRFAVHDGWVSFQQKVTTLQQLQTPWFERLGQDAAATAADEEAMRSLQQAYEAAHAAAAELNQELALHTHALQGTPHLLNTVYLLGRGGAVAGQRLAAFRGFQAELLAQVERADPTPLHQEMGALLRAQMQALDEMSRGGVEHLQRGFRQLCDIQPRVLELSRALQQMLDEHATAECLRQLQASFAQAKGGGDRAQVHAELSLLQQRLRGVLGQYDALRVDGSLAAYGDALRDNLTRLLAAIDLMKQGCAAADMARMAEGLEAAQAAGGALVQARTELRAAPSGA